MVRELTYSRMQGALEVLKLNRTSSWARSGGGLCGSGALSALLPGSLPPAPGGAWKLYRSHMPSSKNAPTSVGKERETER